MHCKSRTVCVLPLYLWTNILNVTCFSSLMSSGVYPEYRYVNAFIILQNCWSSDGRIQVIIYYAYIKQKVQHLFSLYIQTLFCQFPIFNNNYYMYSVAMVTSASSSTQPSCFLHCLLFIFVIDRQIIWDIYTSVVT